LDLLNDAKTALSNMARNQISPDTATINAFLQSLCSFAKPKVAEGFLLLTAMMDLKLMVPDDFTYSILFKALGKGLLYFFS